MKERETLGIYTFFPERSHYSAHIKFNVPIIDLQRTILNLLYKLNGCKAEGSLLSLVEPNVEAFIEFGVADGLVFNYLDVNTLDNLLKAISGKILRVLDFLCIIRYYKVRSDKRVALRSDFFFLRFLFNNDELEIQVFHEKGLQRVSTKDLVKFLVERIRFGLMGRDRALSINK
ncbi:MAG: hypothetical protein QXR84_01850 [Candidatus Bathyarchaeia archaeon]|nr:hypothetical protein [Candidatus Bathyarchaeota archaeon]